MKPSVIWTFALLLVASAAPAQDEATPAAAEGLRIEQTKFGLNVQDREIAEEITTFYQGDVVYLWMRVLGGPADPIQVTWTSGDFTDTASLNIGSNSWRTWAKKTLFQPGDWSVKISGADGTELWSTTFNVAAEARP